MHVRVGLIVFAISLLASGPAWAISISPNPLPLYGPDEAALNLVGAGVGLPAGGVVLDGTVAAGDIVLAFEFEAYPSAVFLPAGTFEWNYAVGSPATPTMTAVGTVLGPGLDIASATAGAPGGLSLAGVLDPGTTSDVFFIAFATSPVGAEIDFSGLGGLLPLGSFTVVPEPTTSLLLLVAGAACLGAGRGRPEPRVS